MTELITNRITAHVLWIPEAWGKCGFTERDIETAVVHAIHEGKDEIRIYGKNNEPSYFTLKEEPIEGSEEQTHRGMVEINLFTTVVMTRYYVSLTQATL